MCAGYSRLIGTLASCWVLASFALVLTMSAETTARADLPSGADVAVATASDEAGMNVAIDHRSRTRGESDASGVCNAARRDDYVSLVRAEAQKSGLPASIAEAVAHIESRYRPEKIGKAGEIGLMQIRPATAAMLGFRGSFIELAEPATNIAYGVAYLARAWRLADGDLCRALTKYRAGHRAERMTALSKTYCALARNYLRESARGVDAAHANASMTLVSAR